MKITRITLLLLSVSVLIGCNRSDAEFEGPSLDNVFGDFSVIEDFTVSNSAVDFAGNESTYFNAQFSKQVDWEINITGLQTGAHKVITGLSDNIGAALSTWDGSTTHLPMFAAESCAIKAEVFDASDSLLYQYFDTIQVVTPKLVDGLLVADFEDGIPTGWGNFIQSGANMSYLTTSDVQAGQVLS